MKHNDDRASKGKKMIAEEWTSRESRLMEDDAVEFPMEMDPRQACAFLRKNSSCILLDVREAEEHAHCAIEGSIHLPLGTLSVRLAILNPAIPIVVYCHHGVRSLAAVRMLRAKGFGKASSLRGGIDLWTTQIDPSLSRY